MAESHLEPVNQIRHLLAMAAVDGGVTREEMNLLADRADELGISPEGFDKLIAEAAAGSHDLHIPRTQQGRFQLLAELIKMMGADGLIHDHERQFFALVATRLNFSATEIDRVIDAALGDGPA
jgi:uncharacterized tellurite resistance protein B-like protein